MNRFRKNNSLNIRQLSGGFSLVEMAIVLLVLGLIGKATLLPLKARFELRQRHTAETMVTNVRNAIVGHLLRYGSLPCPLKRVSVVSQAGYASTTTPCSVSEGGIPAVALGMSGPVDAAGALLDPWGRAYRYAITSEGVFGSSRQPANSINTAASDDRLVARLQDTVVGDLSVCRQSVEQACRTTSQHTSSIAFVVLSTGVDTRSVGVQRENTDGDRVFAVAPRSQVDEHAFDDIVTFASINELVYQLANANLLSHVARQ